MNILIQNSPIHNKGLFTTIALDVNLVILHFEGIVIDASTKNYLLQIDSKLYLNCNGYNGDFINHSCNPNCLVKFTPKNAFLTTIRPINAGEELTYDYSLTADSPQWSITCNCGIYACRKNIMGYNALPDKVKQSYLYKKFVPEYLIEK
jgi:uncharacterized protein